MQHTLKDTVTIEGIGLHSGAPANLTLKPATEDHGIVFKRTDITDKDNLVPARWDHVADTQLCTLIANKEGATVSTVEHLMAALNAYGVDNVLVEIDGPEVPQMDGSSKAHVDAIESAGVQAQTKPRRVIKILKDVEAVDGDKRVSLKPYDRAAFHGEIHYDHAAIGSQHYEFDLSADGFRDEIGSTRSFCLLQDVDAMRAAGLAKGGSLENAVVFDDNGVMNPEGLRFDDECIRHKILDAVGDLYMAGARIQGLYEGIRIGHAMNNAVLKALFADDSAWEWAEINDDNVVAAA